MAAEETLQDAGELAVRWRSLVTAWAGEGRASDDGESVVVEFDLPGPPGEPGTLSLRFMRTSHLLVVFMTDGRPLPPGRLARAAATANAWNTEQLVPMLSVWDVHGPHPVLAGVCSLPLGLRMGPREFAVVAADWAERGAAMFVRCRQVVDQ
ncbi:hypothetical protein [Actinocorallia longicatena]|uniref:Sensory transduction regulator n=1 Tax=Actinocorallia longicatena TaxID=111803 RepID=A0ABP6PXG4_9ACTN